jgi:hypothetical protein
MTRPRPLPAAPAGGIATEAAAEPRSRDFEVIIASWLVRRWSFLLIALLVALTILALGILSPLTTRVAFEIRTRSLSIAADGNGASMQVSGAGDPVGVPLEAGSNFRVSGRFLIVPPGVALAVTGDDDPRGTLEARVDAAVLLLISLEPRARLSIETAPGGGIAYSSAAGVALTLQLAGSVEIAGNSGSPPAAIANAASLVAAADGQSELRALMVPAKSVTGLAETGIEDLAVTSLSFSRRRLVTDNRPPFRSEVVDGTIRLLNVDRTATLSSGDSVKLGCSPIADTFRAIGVEALLGVYGRNCFALHLSSVRVENDLLVVQATGEVERIEIGPLQVLEDVTPSLLAYLVSPNNLPWSAALAGFLLVFRSRQWARDLLRP